MTAIYRDEMLQALGVGLLAAALIAMVERNARDRAQSGSDERPDHAVLTEVDLTALADGEAQTVGTAQGETVRLEAVGVEEETDE
ncbi:hypothetical protein [Haloarcula pellucida]|uniref:Uncharacterized protein n=1 Tax=Haloarcula pellucida TaxID=1427151 RepID=A0A830GMQ3_9EURY|nr:hypothetical protein [Halomicroarcula pellucida]MBX0348247.1 hypothetical protein [Halomicroarcula pellucida]GGN97663.1 hypothetical protein GCM10009030_27160 [Halomicroarcula pellucida]